MASFGLYRLFAFFLAVLGWMALPFAFLIRHRYRHWLKARLFPKPLKEQPQIWLHGVSVGEIKIALTLYQSLPKANQGNALFSATTPAGLAFLEKHLPNHCQCAPLPWDLAILYRKWFSGKSVPNLLLVETELWPNLFHYVKSQGARVGVINARMSSKTSKWQRLGVLRKTVGLLDLVAARSVEDGDSFEACGLRKGKVQVTGNMKFDFQTSPLLPGPLLQWLQLPGRTLVFASMAAEEVGLLHAEVAWFLETFTDLRILWAPRQIQEAARHGEVLAALSPVFRSALREPTGRLLILDTLGELSGCYIHAALSFVGGSFNKRGGQNFLESLQVGTPALVGPSTENFRHEVAEAVAANALLVVESPAAMKQEMALLLNDPKRLRALADNAETFISRHAGAVARTVDVLVDSGWLRNTYSEAS